MTCVVAIIEDGKTYMGTDSLGVGGYACSNRADEKLFYNGKFLIGGTTSFRMLDILRYKFTPPVIDPDMDDLRKYMCTLFIDDVRTEMGAGGFRKKENEVEQGGLFMVAIRDRLFTIYEDFRVAQESEPYAAVGCGSDIALGSLFSTHDLGARFMLDDLGPEDRIQVALEAAEQFSAGVRRPFHILSTKA